MSRKSIWTPEIVQFIKDNAATLKDKEIALQLSISTGTPISVQSVRKQRQKLGITKASGRGRCVIKDTTLATEPVKTVIGEFPVVAPETVISIVNDTNPVEGTF